MKIAISNIAWPPARDARAAALLAAANVAGLELAPTLLWERPTETAAADLEAYRDRWLDKGVRIVAMQALLFGQPGLQLFGDAGTRQRMADHLTRMAQVAAHLGAWAMVFGAPGNRRRGALAADAALDAAVDFFRPLAARVADLGTCLSIEANSPAYGCDFLTSTAEAAEFVRRVDHLGVRLQLDTSTMAMNGEDYAREITSGLPIAGHVHASEPHLVPLGQGGTDHATAARALHDGAYDGWVSIEMRAVPGDDNLASVAAAIDLARATYGDDT